MANASNVATGKAKVGGAVFCAPVGTTLPTTASAELAEGFVDVGYSSEDGLSNDMSRTSNVIKAWGGDTVLTIQNDATDTFTFKLIEAKSVEALKVVFGASNVSGALETGITVKKNVAELEAHSWVFDMIFGDGDLKRIVVPSASITEIGEVTYTDEDATGYEITITPTADANGNTHYEYILKGGSNG